MSTKGNIAKGFSASYDVLDVGEFIRFKDGSKLRQGAEAQSLNESTGGSLAFGNPFDVGPMRIYTDVNAVTYFCLKDLSAPTQADQNLNGYKILRFINS